MFKGNLKALLLKNVPHLLAILILFLSVISATRIALSQVVINAGTGTYSSFGTFLVQTIGPPIWEIRVAGGILLTQIFSLPFYSIEVIFFVFYEIICAIFMYLFVYRYLGLVFDLKNKTPKILFALLGSLIYVYFPYNLLGDNFPELFFIRALMPLYLLLILEFTERKSAFCFLSSSALLGYMTINDPRALLFGPTLAFFFIIAPKISSNFKLKPTLLILAAFVLNIGLSFLLSDFSLFPRLATSAIPTNVSTPFVQGAFRYELSGVLNTFRGLSFEGTNQAYSALVAGLPSIVSSVLTIAYLLTPILTFSILSLIGLWQLRRTKTQWYAIIPLLFTLILLLFFMQIGDEPLFEKILFAVPLGRVSSSVKSLVLLFRTPRFTNTTLAFVYGVFSPLALAISYEVFVNRNQHQANVWRGIKKKLRSKRMLFFIILGIYLFSILSNASLFVVSGNSFSDQANDRVRAYEEVRALFEEDVGYQGFVSIPYAVTTWNFPEPAVGMAESVERYFYAYTLSPEIETCLLDRNETQELASALAVGGIKYVVVDGYEGNQTQILPLLSQSSSFTYVTTIGELTVYRNNDFQTVNFENPILALGGLQTYTNMINVLSQMSKSSSFAPVFLDSPIDSGISNVSAPVFSSPNMSILDLMAPFLITDNRSLIIAPAEYSEHYDPSTFWSPGFVSDVNQGVWTQFWSQDPTFDWQYSYNPDYGFAFTSGIDTLNIQFNVPETGSYQIFVRVLMHPENGSLTISIDNHNIPINTAWSFNSTEFIWMNLGEFNLQKGSHSLKITNQEGLNAINLMLVMPSNEVQQVMLSTQQYYNHVGDVKLVASDLNSTNLLYDANGDAQFSFNVFEDGNYSILLHVSNTQGNANTGVSVIVGNTAYKMRLLSRDSADESVEGVSLTQGQQTLEIPKMYLQNASNISILVYGPQGSLADQLMSQKIMQEPRVSITYLHVKSLSSSYSEYDISFAANSTFMMVLPELYTGTVQVSASNGEFVNYSTFPIYDVFTGILFNIQETNRTQQFNIVIYTQEGRSFLNSSETTLIVMSIMIILGLVIDLIILKRNKWTLWREKLRKPATISV
jgi:hypothetical protein